MSQLKMLFISVLCAMSLAACDSNDGAGERLGERADNAAESAGDSLENAAENVEDSAEDACEKMSKEDC